MLSTLLQSVRVVRNYLRLPAAARRAFHEDRNGQPSVDAGIPRVLEEATNWICRAQDNSATQDGGVARHYSLLTGWGPSYPEATGLLLPTVLRMASIRHDETLRQRGRRMLDWLVRIQLPGGGFQASTVDARPVVPVVFNTGQILLGLAAGVREFGDTYRPAMLCAADWLVSTQDADGCWRKFESPYARSGDKTYDTHVAWGLLEAARLAPEKPYARAALAHIRWALTQQHANGWLQQCCLSDHAQPLTHTLGYALRGIVEAHRFTEEEVWLAAARKTAEGLLSAQREDGFLPGRLDATWSATVPWSCLTGCVQIACCWFYLYQATGDRRYLDAGRLANRFVRSTVKVEGPAEIRGAVKGSFPIDGAYCAYEYPNWACKFLIDALLHEKELEQI